MQREWQADLAVNHGKVAMILALQGKKADARKEFNQGRAILSALKGVSPDNAKLAENLAWIDGEIAKLDQAGAAAPQAAQPDKSSGDP
jgi:Flp pilus assembly protein TadD